MAREPVEVTVGGRTFRVVATSDPATLARLARVVDAKLDEVDSRHPQAMLLAAMSLAHELESLRAEKAALQQRSRVMLNALLERVDDALEHVDENGDPLPPVRPAHTP